ncbi:MAG: hypothetical protein NTY69_10305 [Methylococcales bacterium]|nr:hypothetical protein [Methylococcales bacterium]
MKIVLNTSPIIFLSKIDTLKHLTDCIDEVYVSSGVVEELNGYILPSFINVQSISRESQAYVKGALGQLHNGELEAMMLAQEIGADYVVLDDLLARRKAHNYYNLDVV